ncbi:MAG: glycosyltransferase [Microscillaceae bacterium]|nr:glycosyltransferase [Microscillaceae bacterium]
MFAYNRLVHLQQTVAALQANHLAPQSKLIVYADGPKNAEEAAKVREVQAYLPQIEGFAGVEIHAKTQNQGLAHSVIAGVSEVMAKYGRAIVLEDDLLTTPDFLTFMNTALDYYAGDTRIFSLSGYRFPFPIPANYPHDVLVLPRASSWGWATWHNRWQKADWKMLDFENFKKNRALQKAFNAGGPDLSPMLCKQQKGWIDSWAIRWIYAHFKHQAWALYPTISKVRNIGNDGSGTHSHASRRFESDFREAPLQFISSLSPEPEMQHQLRKFFRRSFYRLCIDYFTLGLY